ncbi:MAG: DUF4132 domain-containing protein [Myxococcales bacterium]|nr:DUF4132 domain-containing protein [Myxococcales bacterium]
MTAPSLAALPLPAWTPPPWLATVPPPTTRDGAPIDEAARLRVLAALERADARAALEAWLSPASLRAHAWAVVEAWAAHGADPRQGWVFAGLAVVSDDELEERLLPDATSAEGARAIFEEQRARLERALSTGRDWSVADWRYHLVEHPMLRPLVRGLVWIARDGGVAFALEDDGRFTDAEHLEVHLDPRGRVALAHPAELGDLALATWGERFADAEVVQPIAQLARPVERLAEAAGDTLPAPSGEAFTPEALASALEATGWVRGEPDERMRVCHFHRAFSSLHAVLAVSPGFGPRESTPQVVSEAFFLARRPGGVTFATEPRVALADVSQVAISEVLYDLGGLEAQRATG